MLRNLFAIAVAVCLSGCPESPYLTVTDASDISHPRMCLSNAPNCTGRSVPAKIVIFANAEQAQQYTLESPDIEHFWVIESARNVVLKDFVYGVPPKGWTELQESKPFQLNTWYLVGHQIGGGEFEHYLRFSDTGGSIRGEVLTRSQYWTLIHSGE